MRGRFIIVSCCPSLSGPNDYDQYFDGTDIFTVVQASRTILFDTHSRIGLDFGVLFAWVGLSISIFPFSAMFMRWKKKRGWA